MGTGIVSAAPAVAASLAPDGAAAASTGGPGVSSSPAAYARALKSKDWVATPDGLMNKSCVQRLPAGAVLDRDEVILASGARQRIGTCSFPRLVRPQPVNSASVLSSGGQPPVTNGWWAQSNWNSPNWLSLLYVKYAVPTAPAVNGALTYLFSSFISSDDTAILQPVLTYGANGTPGGGNYWYLTSWYLWASNSRMKYGPDIRVSPGDTIVGQLTATNCSSNGYGCTWAISAEDLNTGGASSLTVVSDSAFTSAQGGVLESYYATSCNMMPANGHGVFRNITLGAGLGYRTLTPSFTVSYPSPKQCSISETASSTGADILWKP
jgi:hypothetical protein